MDNNVYKPPTANLAVESRGDEPPFYIVSPRKFLILYLGTLGFYELYWFYQNWHLYRRHEGIRLWPIPRAIFSIFFMHSLCRRINEKFEAQNKGKHWDHASIAGAYVVFTFISNADRLTEKYLGEAWSFIIGLSFVPILCWLLYSVQLKINLVCQSQNGEENDEITALNLIWLLLGAALWILVIFSLIAIVNPELAAEILRPFVLHEY